MILIDANILLYAYHPQAPEHGACRRWVEKAFSGSAPVFLTWITILAFLRISTSPRVFDKPLSMAEAKEIVSRWIAAPAVSILEPSDRYWKIFSDLLLNAQVSGSLVTDAALAALAIEHGTSICTTDRDFTRFPRLKLLNPVDS